MNYVEAQYHFVSICFPAIFFGRSLSICISRIGISCCKVVSVAQLCLKSKTSRLDRVSTTCGSGWVRRRLFCTLRQSCVALNEMLLSAFVCQHHPGRKSEKTCCCDVKSLRSKVLAATHIPQKQNQAVFKHQQRDRYEQCDSGPLA